MVKIFVVILSFELKAHFFPFFFLSFLFYLSPLLCLSFSPFVLLCKDCSCESSVMNIGCSMLNMELDWVNVFDTSEHMFLMKKSLCTYLRLMNWMHYCKISLNLILATKPTWIRRIVHKLKSFFMLSSLDLTKSKSLKTENWKWSCINKDSLDNLWILFLQRITKTVSWKS